MRCSLLFLAALVVLGSVEVRARAEDPPPPSQALPTDRAQTFARFAGSVVVRAPFDRSYGFAFGFAPMRFVEIDLRFAMREDRAVELGAGLGLRPLGRTFEAWILRASAHAILGEQGAPSATGFRLDLETGYTLRIETAFVEATLGASDRRRGPYQGASSWAFALAFRAGVAY